MAATLRNAHKAFIAAAAVASVGLSFTTTPASAGIVGGDFRSTAAVSINGIVGGDRAILARNQFAVVGPIEKIDLKARTVTILGQQFAVTATSRVHDQITANATVLLRSLKSLWVGQYVVAGGAANGSKLILAELQSLGSSYVAGSSSIYMRGVVTGMDASTGRLMMGSVVVDYTATLFGGTLSSPSVGTAIELYGTQPARGGIVLAADLAWQGSTNGIIGGDMNGIVGGDMNGIVGGDMNGIVGGDMNGIVGGDMNGIVGGDMNGIVGGDMNGIVGGDMAVNGIVGGDMAVNGIVGGDMAVNGIVGGDMAVNGIIGGDMAVNGIVGGDMAVNGIVGGDTRRN